MVAADGQAGPIGRIVGQGHPSELDLRQHCTRAGVGVGVFLGA